jgi:hypothetical protein
MGHLDSVKVLASLGAEVSVRKKDWPIPVLAAAGEGHWEVLKALASLGADLNVADSD